MPSERVQAAVDELKAALAEEGMDPGTTEAQLKYILPPEETVVGNYADLQRMGAIINTGVMPTPPGQEDVVTSDITAAFTATNPMTQDLNDDNKDSVPADGLDAMTKAELQDEADRKGITVPASATKAEIIEALQAG